MRSIRLLLAVVVVAAACDSTQTDPSSGSATTAAATTTTAAATTTVDPEQACRDVADRLAGLLGDVLDELDELDAATFSDRTTWPEDLLELETVGVELDRESARLGCDPGALQAEALSTIAGREPRSLLSRWLLQLLLGDSP